MGIAIREYTKEDFPKLLLLSDDEWSTVHIGTASMLKQSDDKISRCYLAMDEDDQKVVGYIYGFVLPNKTLIPEFLYVLPEYRRKGIGKKLIQSLEDNSGCTASMIFYNKSLHDYYQKQEYITGDDLEIAMKELRSNG